MSGEEPQANEPKAARLVIADDHELVRAGIRSMLLDEPDLEVVGEAANGAEAVSICRRVRPDLVLMDVSMPEMDGLEATYVLKRDLPRTSVIILTMRENPDYLFEAIKAGASGYVLKDASQRELLDAIRKVLGGESLLHPELAARLLYQLAGSENPSAPPLPESLRRRPGPPFEPLTPREEEVLRLLARGQTNPQIAQKLVIGVGIVKIHVGHIIDKLGASDRTQAAVQAVLLGLVTLDW